MCQLSYTIVDTSAISWSDYSIRGVKKSISSPSERGVFSFSFEASLYLHEKGLSVRPNQNSKIKKGMLLWRIVLLAWHIGDTTKTRSRTALWDLTRSDPIGLAYRVYRRITAKKRYAAITYRPAFRIVLICRDGPHPPSLRLQFVKQGVHAVKDRLLSRCKLCFYITDFFPELIQIFFW